MESSEFNLEQPPCLAEKKIVHDSFDLTHFHDLHIALGPLYEQHGKTVTLSVAAFLPACSKDTLCILPHLFRGYHYSAKLGFLVNHFNNV